MSPQGNLKSASQLTTTPSRFNVKVLNFAFDPLDMEIDRLVASSRAKAVTGANAAAKSGTVPAAVTGSSVPFSTVMDSDDEGVTLGVVDEDADVLTALPQLSVAGVVTKPSRSAGSVSLNANSNCPAKKLGAAASTNSLSVAPKRAGVVAKARQYLLDDGPEVRFGAFM